MNLTGLEIRAAIKAASDKPRLEKGVLHVIGRHYHEDGIVERVARFQRFYAETIVKPFAWGTLDCSLSVGDWAVLNGHPDPASHLRGAYDSEATCRALIAARGGLVEVFRDCSARANLKPLYEPRFGCAAVIGSARRLDRQWGAIWNGRRWMVALEHKHTGLCFFSPITAKPLAMWGI
jgi:hypothetical protein